MAKPLRAMLHMLNGDRIDHVIPGAQRVSGETRTAVHWPPYVDIVVEGRLRTFALSGQLLLRGGRIRYHEMSRVGTSA